MDEQTLGKIIASLLGADNKSPYVTIDELMDVLDEYNIPITKTDYVASIINGYGVRIFNHTPSEQELIAIEDSESEAKDPDYAQTNYEAVFSEALEIDPGLEGLISFIRTIRPAQHGEANYIYRHISEAGKKRIFEMSLRSVVRIALSVYRSESLCHTELADLIQVGCLGLLNAIEKYDVNDDSVFGSYANYWIFQYISRDTTYRGNGCYFPVHISDSIKDLARFIEKKTNYTAEEIYYQHPETVSIISEHYYRDNKFIRTILSYLLDPISIDALDLYGEDELIFSDNGSFEENMVQLMDDRTRANRIEKLFLKLSEKESDIIKLRYGFYDGKCLTLEECGQKYGVTRERIRQIEKKAIRKLHYHISRLKIEH